MGTSIQLVFDAADPAALSRFWAEALGYRLEDPPAGFESWEDFLEAQGIPRDRWNDASAIVDPHGNRPRIYFQRVPEPKIAKNRLHMDLSVGGDGQASGEERRRRIDAEVKRLKSLGATDERGAIERKGGEYWVRMNDPEGNEFCVQ